MSDTGASRQANRKTWVGEVISSKMDKTVVVLVQTKVKHPVYQKYVNRRKRFYAHDADDSCQVGDTVVIEECRPLSRLKRWSVREIQNRNA